MRGAGKHESCRSIVFRILVLICDRCDSRDKFSGPMMRSRKSPREHRGTFLVILARGTPMRTTMHGNFARST